MTERIRYTRKDLKGPDEFVSALGRAVAWVRGNRLKLGIALGALLLLSGGAIGLRAYLAWQEQKASGDLWAHLNRAREALQAPAEANPEKTDRLAFVIEGLAAQQPRSKAALYARYYLGSLAFLRGDYRASAAQFRAALPMAEREGAMAYFVRQGLAQALEAEGDTEAAAAYAEAASRAAGEMRVEALLGQARALLAQGRRDEAGAVYRQVLAESPDTPMKELVEIKLSQLG